MIRRIQVIMLALCVLLGTAGFLSAQRSTGPKHPPFKAKAADSIIVTTQLGYQAGLISEGLYYPNGIGVSTRGDSIFYTQEDYGDVFWNHDHTVTPIGTPSPYLHACRVRGGLYVGDGLGNIFRIDDRQVATWLGHDEYGDDVACLDVDLQTGTVYFIANYSGGYYWSGLYALPRNTDTAILIDWWYDYPSWGLAVKGNLLYVTDYYSGIIRAYPKKGGKWKEIVSGLNGPTDIGFDKLGNMFVAEWNGGSVARVKAGSLNIVRIASGFDTPYYLQLDGSGNIYVADNYAGEIWKLRK